VVQLRFRKEGDSVTIVRIMKWMVL